MIHDSESNCWLDMMNSGMINAGANLPAYLQTPSTTGATKKYEDKFLCEIENMDANAIVYSSRNQQYCIDGKNMKTRFPRVDA